jgi:uncharacterized membrane protein
LLAVLTLALALVCTLVVVDSGRLYLEKRSLQRVADMAALEAAGLNGSCSATNTANAYAVASATRNGFTVTDSTRTLTTQCGSVSTGADGRRVLAVDVSKTAAISVTVSHAIPRSIAAGVGAMFDSTPTPQNITVIATATATPPLPPLAQLTISSTLATIDSTRSAALNLLWGQLLGGTLNVSTVGYQGLTDANINLLKYLDQLAIDVHATAGDYTTLLGTDIKISQLLNSGLAVLPQASQNAQTAVNGLNLAAGNATVKLQNLINLQSGSPAAALNTSLNLFNLAQGLVQAANSKNGLAANMTFNLGVASIIAKVQVVQPAQLSAIGDPSKNPQNISVHTAQVKTLFTVDLGPVTSSLKSLLTSVLGALTPVSVASSLDISIEVASATTQVTGYSCASDATKSLTALTKTSGAIVKGGTINPAAWTNNATAVGVSPMNLATITLLGQSNVSLMIDTPLAQTTQSAVFAVPNEIGATPYPVVNFNSQNMVGGLQNSTITASINGPVVGILGLLLNGLLNNITSLISGLLSPLLDPLLNQLLSLLGIGVSNVQVGGNLSCHLAQAGLVI